MLKTHRILTGLAVVALLSVVVPTNVTADDAQIDVGNPKTIVLEPSSFQLKGHRSRQQLIVTGQYGAELIRDLTLAAEFNARAWESPQTMKLGSPDASPMTHSLLSSDILSSTSSQDRQRLHSISMNSSTGRYLFL